MEKHILSKSTFQRGRQCYKSLYLYKNKIFLRDPLSTKQKAVFNRGNKVGLLAQQLFPGGVDVSKLPRLKKGKRSSAQMVVDTQRLIEEGCSIIYEAAFQYDGVLVILDILVKENSVWNAYEVKSSAKISNTYKIDAAVQHWVISNAGIKVNNFFLVNINTSYVKNGSLDVFKLFKLNNVSDAVKQLEGEIEEQIKQLLKIELQTTEPDIDIGEHCYSPYKCDFIGNCWQHIPKKSVFDIVGAPKEQLFKLFAAGYKTVNDIPDNNELSIEVNKHIASVKKNKPIIDKNAINTFLSKISYPVLFVDFEIVMPAIPKYDKTKPYQHLPFQYSLHIKNGSKEPVLHMDYLAETGEDPRSKFLDSLLRDTKDGGTVLVYDALMEKAVLKELRNIFPEKTVAINQLLNRMVDLKEPIKNKYFYHPDMNNSFSLKNVNSALFSKLQYENLEVSSGSVAMVMYESLEEETDMFKQLEIKEHLRSYCKLDTMVMVKLLEELELQLEE